MTDRNTEAMRTLRNAVRASDLPDLIRRQSEMADALARVALREEYDNPAVSVRAAASAARILSDTVAAVVVEERLSELRSEIDEMHQARRAEAGKQQPKPMGDTIGLDASGTPVARPFWGRGTNAESKDAQDGSRIGPEQSDGW